MYQRGQLGKIRIGEETIEREDECAVRLFQATLFIPWLSLTYRTDHITPIPPNRAMLRLTGWSVNTSKIHLPLQPLSLSSDPEQDMFSSNHCQRVSENSATPSLILFVTLSSLGLLFPERSKQRRQERCTCAIVRDRYFLDTRLHLCLLACLTSPGASLLGHSFNRCHGSKCQQPHLLLFLPSTVLSQPTQGLSPNMRREGGDR